jgi:hypothetical protein
MDRDQAIEIVQGEDDRWSVVRGAELAAEKMRVLVNGRWIGLLEAGPHGEHEREEAALQALAAVRGVDLA